MIDRTFGEILKEKRLILGITLRKFCLNNRIDPGNYSRVERDINNVPRHKEMVIFYAQALSMNEVETNELVFIAGHTNIARIKMEFDLYLVEQDIMPSKEEKQDG